MDTRTLLQWPIIRQLTGDDPLGRGNAVTSEATASMTPRTADADSVAHSVCPYCAVGCAQLVYGKDGRVMHVEGDANSPVSRGRLCPNSHSNDGTQTSRHRKKKCQMDKLCPTPRQLIVL